MFFTDWEGPWILTDFALELTMAVFNNERFFRNLSLYDDYLAYEVKKEGYEAGYTVKLLVPFIAAADITEARLANIAELTAKFVPDASEAMRRLQKMWKPVVISTSYRQYLEETASMIGVEGYLHGTDVSFDRIKISSELRSYLISTVDKIAGLKGEELFRFLDDLFSTPEIEEIVSSVRAVGAGEKAEILRCYCEEYSIEFPVAIGDSISDYKMFEVARKLGGVAVAFNGNEYALKHADIAIVSSTAMSEAAVVELLLRRGMVDSAIHSACAGLRETEIYIMSDSDYREVLEKSKRMRVRLRGFAGELG
ncbi:haloacid dehalogenase-like hydrolase [Archaeoglobus neptunius]|uniref:haloacid dehalogenase-like hydrolase n=1 Tax=Archaeoglobus neptunius TaxID=2798580 RepID=UPI0019266978|nr:haloacid dehalogenase-like hydrolase [Archaeoglobus neptunius]